METIIAILKQNDLLFFNQEQLNSLKDTDCSDYRKGNYRIYSHSLYKNKKILYFIGKKNQDKHLYLACNESFSSTFTETIHFINDAYIQKVPYNYDNYQKLVEIFPFIKPISLYDKKTTVGCGDRLALATVGHLLALKSYEVYPILAQQSMRELSFLNRTYQDVVMKTAFQVFQAGYENGYGADGDHLKTLEDIDTAINSDMPMITLDLSEIINSSAADWSDEKVTLEFQKYSLSEQSRLLDTYTQKEQFIILEKREIKRCTVMYAKAIEFAAEVNVFLQKKRGDKYDLEISIDETTTPTLPEHHYYIISELLYRKVKVNSLAPKFIGEFQKGVDYQGDIEQFKKQFIVHCEISRHMGDYKVSIHSGSDKFSIYPVIGKYTDHKLHLKTCGTSWLEAVRCISMVKPELYRKIHKKAFDYYPEAKKHYHIDIDFTKIDNVDEASDELLPQYLNQADPRKLIHITFGGLLTDPEIKDDFYQTLIDYEDEYNELLKAHFSRHLQSLGIKKKDNNTC
ncbi:MAG: tagaturonate epimerase family protein [Spirochaetes bacterium]|nr:tagaturonate epimerase family protein [Spirochaetota bacterium]